MCLGRHLLVGELGDTRQFGGVLDGDRTDVPIGINIENGVLVEVLGFGYRARPELNVERVGVSEARAASTFQRQLYRCIYTSPTVTRFDRRQDHAVDHRRVAGGIRSDQKRSEVLPLTDNRRRICVWRNGLES